MIGQRVGLGRNKHLAGIMKGYQELTQTDKMRSMIVCSKVDLVVRGESGMI